MKKILFILIIMINTAESYSEGERKPYEGLPYYAREFLSKIGVDSTKISPSKLWAGDVNKFLSTSDWNAILSAARQAKDTYMEVDYFKIRVIRGSYVIRKDYPLIDRYSELCLFLDFDENGKIVSCSFIEGSRS